MEKEILLIDGHGLAYRGFFALPAALVAEDGTPTNAIVGFLNMLFRILDEDRPKAVGIFFDPKGKTKRNEMYTDYKAGRRPTPDEFKIQIPLIIEICEAMGFSCFSREKTEADDFIISTARVCAAMGEKVKILSADKDLLQALDKNITILRPAKGVTDFSIYTEESFKYIYGFSNKYMADYLALLGDQADNIPGVAGIGEKTAAQLVAEYGSLDKIYANLENIPKSKRSKLEIGKELAYKSLELILPIETQSVTLESMLCREADLKHLAELCKRLGLKKVAERFGIDRIDRISDDKELLEAKNICIDEILHAKELSIAVEDKNNFILATAGRKICRVDISCDESKEKYAKWCKYADALYLWDLRKMLAEYPDLPMPSIGKIHDVKIAYYLLHPDRSDSKGIEKTLGKELPSGIKFALSLFNMYSCLVGEDKYSSLKQIEDEIDKPLSNVLAKMQHNGIYVDVDGLESLKKELADRISQTENNIAEIANIRINLASPKQVGEMLFEKLQYPVIKKTKTGYSTDNSVLEELAMLPEPMNNIPKLIIQFREESKLLSGFVEPFLRLGRDGNGIIHSTFDHLATGTGRLASSEPNVQNMPVFGEIADKFRGCFVPRSDDYVFIAADYSQIELRVMAEITKEERLIEAFEAGRDIHLETASWVFGLEPESVTAEHRKMAKVVNFGLLYGMSAFGLAQRLGISRKAASGIVERYFDALPMVKRYFESCIKETKERGYTISKFGRIRPLSEVATIEGRGNDPISRIAVNTPIQSTASDIAKIALLQFDKVLEEKIPEALIILQVHDSIVCECPEAKADESEELLVKTMENVKILDIPLKVVSKRGKSLKDL